MMKAAIMQVNIVNTVSPSYAMEIHDPWFSHGLDPILNIKGDRVIGILNGIDIKDNDPKTDENIYKNYDAKHIEDKKVNKLELMKEMGLEPDENRMLIGMVSRMASHKGLDLVKYIFHDLMRDNVSVVILGSGEEVYENFFREMQNRYPGRVAVKIGFIPSLSKKIYAGADAFLMPSKSEPCGLAQMVAARYGTLPIVRETGGLKDSIHDMGDKNGNGFTFKTYNAHDMLGAIQRAEGLFGNKPLWKKAMLSAMESDFSWNKSAGDYVNMYKMILKD